MDAVGALLPPACRQAGAGQKSRRQLHPFSCKAYTNALPKIITKITTQRTSILFNPRQFFFHAIPTPLIPAIPRQPNTQASPRRRLKHG